jgi:hypothetical protein
MIEGKRRKVLRDRVRELMEDGGWRTLRQISDATNGSEAGVSARLRDLRKAPFNRTVEKKMDGDSNGLWWYRLVPLKQGELFS